MIQHGGVDASLIMPYGYAKMSTTVLLAIPMFVMAGGLIEKGEIGNKLVDLIEVFIGRLRGAWFGSGCSLCSLRVRYRQRYRHPFVYRERCVPAPRKSRLPPRPFGSIARQFLCFGNAHTAQHDYDPLCMGRRTVGMERLCLVYCRVLF